MPLIGAAKQRQPPERLNHCFAVHLPSGQLDALVVSLCGISRQAGCEMRTSPILVIKAGNAAPPMHV